MVNFKKQIIKQALIGLFIIIFAIAAFFFAAKIPNNHCGDPYNMQCHIGLDFIYIVGSLALIIGTALLIITAVDMYRDKEKIEKLLIAEKFGNQPVTAFAIFWVFVLLVLLIGEWLFSYVRHFYIWLLFFVALYFIAPAIQRFFVRKD